MSAETVFLTATALAGGFAIIWLAGQTLRRNAQRKAGFGIAALDSLNQDVHAEVVRILDVPGGWGAGSLIERPYTVVGVTNDTSVTRPVVYRGSRANEIDAETLWQIAPSSHDAIVVDAPAEISFLRGVVVVDERQATFVEPGDLLEPDYLRRIVSHLSALDESAAKAF